MTSRSAVEKAIDTHWIAGLHFWTRRQTTFISVACSNTLGSVEYRIDTDTGQGATIVHSPHRIYGWAETNVTDCPVTGGQCFEGHSFHAFRELLLPILDAGDFPGVLNKLAEIHSGYFPAGVAA